MSRYLTMTQSLKGKTEDEVSAMLGKPDFTCHEKDGSTVNSYIVTCWPYSEVSLDIHLNRGVVFKTSLYING